MPEEMLESHYLQWYLRYVLVLGLSSLIDCAQLNCWIHDLNFGADGIQEEFLLAYPPNQC